MIYGRVDAYGVPVVLLSIAEREWSATIDTGFNGDLELPTSLYATVKARYFGQAVSLLAGGQTIEEDHFVVEFPFDGEMVHALATFVPGDDILIGTNMLRDYRLVIDFPSAEVFLERTG